MQAEAPKQVICINWGTKYGPAYVNRLHAMVARNLAPPFTVTCFTDSEADLDPAIRAEPLPPIDYDLPVTSKGIWPKSRLWGPRLADLRGPVLFLDLDLVITGSLDPFFEVGAPEDVVMAPNRGTPLERMGQTSVFRFPVGKLAPMQRAFARDPQGIAERYGYEQRFVTRNAPDGVRFFPACWVAHFRRNCRWPVPLNFVAAPRRPRRARIVIFPGNLTPEHAIAGQYGGNYPVRSPLQHLRAALGPRTESLASHVRHYIRPAPWVAKYWRL